MVTISHEGGHALVAVLTGRRLMGIRLHADTSGVTLSRGKPTGPGMVAMLAAGYLAPAVAGLGAALLLASGHSLALLWLAVGWLTLMLLQIRNAYGLLVLVVCGAAAGLVSWYLPGTTVSLLAYLLTWVLLLAAPKPVLELMRQRRRPGRPRSSDVDPAQPADRAAGADLGAGVPAGQPGRPGGRRPRPAAVGGRPAGEPRRLTVPRRQEPPSSLTGARWCVLRRLLAAGSDSEARADSGALGGQDQLVPDGGVGRHR